MWHCVTVFLKGFHLPLSLRGSEATEAISCIDNFEIATSAYGGLAMTRGCHKVWSHTANAERLAEDDGFEIEFRRKKNFRKEDRINQKNASYRTGSHGRLLFDIYEPLNYSQSPKAALAFRVRGCAFGSHRG